MAAFLTARPLYNKKIIAEAQKILASTSLFYYKDMAIWRIMDYVEPSGRNPIAEWQAGLHPDAQAWIDARLLQMEAMLKWPPKWVSNYKGYEGIIELRIPFNRVQYRPLSMYSPGRIVILLNGAIEKGGKIPRSDLETASARRTSVLKEPFRVRAHF
jgi:hypothetical protein